jgi:hypothetical protein
MRLLELQRSALGLAVPHRTAWETRFAGDSSPGGTDEQPPERKGAILAVEMNATPASGVIAGAVVTVSLSIANEGVEAAAGVLASVPLPAAASYRAGSLLIDGRVSPDERADQLFGSGYSIEALPAGARATFVWKIGVRLGSKPLLMIPQVNAAKGAVIGARPLSVSRKDAAGAAFSNEVLLASSAILDPKPLIPVEIPADELPFYELDEEEQLVHEAADAALSDAAAPAVTREPEGGAQVAPAVAEPVTDTAPESASETPELEIDPEPEIEPEPEPPPRVREAIVRYGRFDRTTLVFFERTFGGSKPPTLLSHCIFAGALACTSTRSGADDGGLKRQLDEQSQIMHRLSLHEKLGKKEPIGEYAGSFVGDLRGLVPEPVESPEPIADGIILSTEIGAPTLAVLKQIEADRERWDFVKARQLTLALQAQRAEIGDSAANAAIENALRHYAQVSMTTLQKLFVRIRLDRTTGLLFQNEPTLDVAARSLLAALAAVISR